VRGRRAQRSSYCIHPVSSLASSSPTSTHGYVTKSPAASSIFMPSGTTRRFLQSHLIASAYAPWPAPKTLVLPAMNGQPLGIGDDLEMVPENSAPAT
jgi:hypothetical protein